MPQSKKKTTDKRLGEKAPPARVNETTRKDRWIGFVIVAVVVAVIASVVGLFYYNENVAPFRRTLISVDNINVSMGYFLKRAALAGADPMSMMQSITNEQLVKLGAAEYGLKATPEDINLELRNSASGGSGNITESEFREWYRQQLNESRLTDREYREVAATSLETSRLQQFLATKVPTVAKQIHLHAIAADNNDDAEQVRARLKSGEDFATVARDVFTDNASKETGGDLGWFPRGILPSGLDEVAFSLKEGEISDVIPYSPQSDPSSGNTESVPPTYFVFMVSEKADARPVVDEYLTVLKGRALQTWLSEQMSLHDINYYKFDSETYAWMNWQLSKTKSNSGTSGQ